MTPECLKPSSELKDNSKNYFPLNEESSEVENGSVIVLASASEDEEDLTSNTDLCQFGVNEHFTVPESDNEREDDESNIENKELKINTPHRLPVMDKLSPAVDLISVDGDSDDEDNEPHLTTSRLQGSSSPLFSSSHGVKEKVKLSKESLDQMVKLTGALSLNRKNKYDDSSSEDEFENFLGKIKKEVHMKSPSRSEMIPLDEFIVDDDSVSHTDEEEDELFYIKYNNDRLQENKREKREAYPGFDSESSISLSDDDSNSDSDHIETEHHTYRRNLGKKSEKISADLFYDRSNIEAKEDFSIDLLKENSLKSTKSLRSKSEELLEDRHNTCKTSTETFKTPLLNRVLQVHAATNPPPRKPGNIGFDDALHLLNSLSRDYPEYKQHPEAARFVRNFQRTKEELTKRLLFIFNEEVFENKLPKDLEIEWSQRYTKTAGTFCYRGTPSNFKAKITLSVKVCDSPERVRNTLAHELCHAAVKLINGANESHGPIWKSWARKINRKFPFMPTIARCHDYQINTKYTYQCVKCKYRIGRHSKSLDTERKVCGFCLGKFEVYLTKSLNSIKGDNPTTPAPKTPNKFALYVKECYSEKRKGTNLKHGDVMKLLSKEFAEKNKICDQSCQ
ncbi:unnamed protein product [Lymnaea stagnalis]|uniref:SprT-like domain-containing protein n=1 Tax=Lymnaea stagnalis TaxID=6523 RepID=A0AAV2H2V3_LYMST